MAALLAAMAINAHAFSVCLEDELFVPLTNPDLTKPGHAQILMDMVAQSLGVKITYEIAPWKRCQASVGNGIYDAVLGAGYAGINVQIAVFPMLSEGKPDSAKAVGSVKTMLYRRKGSKADYVNGSFINLNAPVGITSGYQVNMVAVTKGGAQYYDGAKTVEQQVKMLLIDRVAMVAGEPAFTTLVNEKYRDKIESLPVPLSEAHYYLVFSNKYYDSQKDNVDTFWREIARVKNSAEYKRRIK